MARLYFLKTELKLPLKTVLKYALFIKNEKKNLYTR